VSEVEAETVEVDLGVWRDEAAGQLAIPRAVEASAIQVLPELVSGRGTANATRWGWRGVLNGAGGHLPRGFRHYPSTSLRLVPLSEPSSARI